ncbi:TonB-dependent receptor [candidate division WOR-3 bacterium]|nr:TonB-dependent receptor [candidate division WOR-3 bacterium]
MILFILTALISGKVYDADTREPLPLVNLSVIGTIYGCSTDTLGEFFLKIPEGEYELKATYIGYEEKLLSAKVFPDKPTKLTIFLKKEAIPLEEVKVSGERISEPSFRVLKADELKLIPFAEMDFFRTLQSFPGVTFISDLIGWLYVRGGMPGENLYLMDGGEVLCPNHYFGVISAFNVDLLDDVKFSCGGFSSRYGDRMSSVMDITTRDGLFGRGKTKVEADLLEAGIESEFSVTPACSYVFSARKNYFKAVAPLVGIEDGIILPDFQNFQNRLSFSLGRNHKISLSSLLVRDEASADFIALDEEAGMNWKNVGNTYVFNYCADTSDHSMRITGYHSYLDSDALGGKTEVNRIKRVRKTGIRQTGEIKFGKKHRVGFGISGSYVDYYAENDYPIEFIGIDLWDQYGRYLSLCADTSTSQFGAYLLTNFVLIEKILLTLGSRYDYISLTQEKTLSPRFRLSYSWDPKTSLFLAWGHYYQFQDFEFLEFNPNLVSAYANHYILGIERNFGEDWTGKLELYEKRINNLAFINVKNEIADNSGYGFARGIEMFLRKSFTNNFFGWISCAFSKSRRTGLFDDAIADFDADQPVAINIIAVYTFGKDYTLSTTYSHTSGTPYTPVAGYIWYYNGWKPVPGPRNSARYPSYDRLDIRFEKGFNIFNVSGDFYFSVLNVFQHRNVQVYSYEENHRQPVYMLPRLAFFGIKFRIL